MTFQVEAVLGWGTGASESLQVTDNCSHSVDDLEIILRSAKEKTRIYFKFYIARGDLFWTGLIKYYDQFHIIIDLGDLYIFGYMYRYHLKTGSEWTVNTWNKNAYNSLFNFA